MAMSDEHLEEDDKKYLGFSLQFTTILRLQGSGSL